MRTSLVQQATELKTYVDKMKQESNNLVSQLQTKVSGYEEKLKKAEEFARQDSLTGLANRRIIEERIESRIVLGAPFCVIMADMNRLKKVNDTHGHPAGDELLQQFSDELKIELSQLRSGGPLGRRRIRHRPGRRHGRGPDANRQTTEMGFRRLHDPPCQRVAGNQDQSGCSRRHGRMAARRNQVVAH